MRSVAYSSLVALLAAPPADGCRSTRQMVTAMPMHLFETTLARHVYAAGDTVDVTVTNVSGASLMYSHSFCQRTLERQHGAAWDVAVGPATTCALVAAYLGPGQSRPLLYHLPADLPLGVYRIAMPAPVAQDAAPTAPATVATAAFTVGP